MVKFFSWTLPFFLISNYTYFQKTTALHVALKNANAEMVDFLLEQPSLNACDAVLIAVKVGNMSLLEIVLAKLEETQPGLEFRACPNRYETSNVFGRLHPRSTPSNGEACL